VQEPTVLLGHAVGAGKTATMVMAGMEMKRLGLVSKPAYVVPKPHARTVSAPSFSRPTRWPTSWWPPEKPRRPTPARSSLARCATGDWDAVVITHDAFVRIPVSEEAEADYLAAQVSAYREAQVQSSEQHGLSVKKLEAAIIRMEERIKSTREDGRRLDGVTFEETGVDYIFLDEAHLAKNLSFPTRIQGVGGAGSKRATDIEVKLRVLRQRHGARVATFATATFVANSISELYVMQRYLQPDALSAAGIATFDAWAANFGRTVTALELAPDGGSYRMKDRFARFANVPELIAMFAEVADVRTAEQLALRPPGSTASGQRWSWSPVGGLKDYVESLVARAEAVSRGAVRPEEDNMLKVTGDGRKAALDLRLVALRPDPDGGKITAAAERITSIWADTKDRTTRSW